MWRRYGDATYALLVLGIFSAEAVSLCVLTWAFAARSGGIISSGRLYTFLLAAVASVLVALVLLAAHLLAYHFISARHDRKDTDKKDAWTKRWIEVLFDDSALETDVMRSPEALPRAGIESALDLLEVLKAEEGERLKEALRRHGVARDLIAGLRSERLRIRLEALEALSKARLGDAYAPALELLNHPTPVVRRMAARAAARTLADMPPDDADKSRAVEFCAAVSGSRLSSGVIEEAILLLDAKAPAVISLLLEEDTLPTTVLRATLATAGRLALADFAEPIAQHALDADPEVRAAAMRALVRAGVLPGNSRAFVLDALNDDADFVRVQAARATALLPVTIAVPALWHRLRDVSWWVRRAAAESLAAKGPEGVETLNRAAETHPDRYARDMAIQVLLESDLVDAETARRLREAA